ncbi:hypothetical protein Ancab_016593 [Ancistrocladus abbreviatus]
MASTLTTKTETKDSSPRRLSELLQEQQDPFILEVYLFERGYSRRCSKLGCSYGCCSAKSSKFFKKSAKYGLQNRRKGLNIARAFRDKLASVNRILRGKNSCVKDGNIKDDAEKRWREKEVQEPERFSSDSCTTVSNSCSETDTETEDTSINVSQRPSQFNNDAIESVTGRMLLWRLIEDSKQCSPDSVLDQIEALPVYNVRHDGTIEHEAPASTSGFSFPEKVTEDSILSASLWELLVQSRREKPSCPFAEGLLGHSEKSPCSQYMNSKKAMQQTKQLLFDCVREVAETHGRKQGREQSAQQLIGPEEIGMIIFQNLRAWGKQSADETKIAQLIYSDVTGPMEKWNGIEVHRREIMVEIGELIFEEIKEEIVRDMIDHSNA